MNNGPLTRLKKEQKLSLGMAVLAAFMGGMKVAGIFAIGTFPFWTEFAASAFMLIYGIFLTVKIKRLEAKNKEGGK